LVVVVSELSSVNFPVVMSYARVKLVNGTEVGPGDSGLMQGQSGAFKVDSFIIKDRILIQTFP
jgi:hypothetical protein